MIVACKHFVLLDHTKYYGYMTLESISMDCVSGFSEGCGQESHPKTLVLYIL